MITVLKAKISSQIKKKKLAHFLEILFKLFLLHEDSIFFFFFLVRNIIIAKLYTTFLPDSRTYMVGGPVTRFCYNKELFSINTFPSWWTWSSLPPPELPVSCWLGENGWEKARERILKQTNKINWRASLSFWAWNYPPLHRQQQPAIPVPALE